MKQSQKFIAILNTMLLIKTIGVWTYLKIKDKP